MSENTYANIYEPEGTNRIDGFELAVMIHPNERDALGSASITFEGYRLVAAAVPFLLDHERAARTVTSYQIAEKQGDVFG